MSYPSFVKRGFSTPLGLITQRVSARLCNQFKHLKYGRLFTEWRQIFPDEMGILYQPIRFSQGKLVVRTSSTQAALLTYFAPSMIESINNYVGGDLVVSIQAQQGVLVKNQVKSLFVTLDPLSADNKQKLEGIADLKLQQALEKWGQLLEKQDKV